VLAEPGQAPPPPILEGAPELPLDADTVTVKQSQPETVVV